MKGDYTAVLMENFAPMHNSLASRNEEKVV
jgi:hypothetical protein